MTTEDLDIEFEEKLDAVCTQLASEARKNLFTSSQSFEHRVREVVTQQFPLVNIDMHPPLQSFPDIVVGKYGIEVKFSEKDTWRSVANSVLETNRVVDVEKVYLLFGKMGGTPDVKWDPYEKCVMHVRTSHVPRFEVEIGAEQALFDQMGISYDTFRHLPMDEKMEFIRKYARSRLKEGERLWWLEDSPGVEHTLPLEVRIYTTLGDEEKRRLRAQAVVLCPEIVKPSRARRKYDNVAMFLLTYHGVVAHQTRDLFSAGSVANPTNDDAGGSYIKRMLDLMEFEIREAAESLDDAIVEEYWGERVEPGRRMARWLEKADEYAVDWKPSQELFQH